MPLSDGLLVDHKEFLQACDNIRRQSKSYGKTSAYLYMELGKLKIQAGRTRTTVEAKGVWPYPIAVNAVMLGRTSLDMPREDPILLQAVQGRLYIGQTLTLDCKKAKSVPNFIKAKAMVLKPTVAPYHATPKRDALNLPTNASCKHVLLLALKYSQEEIAFSGLSGRLEKALMEKNRRITKALAELEIFGVKHKDLAGLVDDVLQRQIAARTPK